MPRLISDFVPEVLALGPYSAPQAAAELAVSRTAIDLCTRAAVWTYNAQFSLQDQVSDYPLITPDYSRLISVRWVDVFSRRYKPGLSFLHCQCGSFFISVPNPRTLVISPPPAVYCDTPLTVQFHLAPTTDADQLPDVLWDEYIETIANGAASRLMQQPKQEYTNQGLANRLFNLYNAGVTRAKNRVTLDHTDGPLMMRGGYF